MGNKKLAKNLTSFIVQIEGTRRAIRLVPTIDFNDVIAERMSMKKVKILPALFEINFLQPLYQIQSTHATNTVTIIQFEKLSFFI